MHPQLKHITLTLRKVANTCRSAIWTWEYSRLRIAEQLEQELVLLERAAKRQPDAPDGSWVVYWSKGPVDDPLEGRYVVKATNALEAVERFAASGHQDHYNVDAVIRAELENMLDP